MEVGALKSCLVAEISTGKDDSNSRKLGRTIHYSRGNGNQWKDGHQYIFGQHLQVYEQC